MICETPINQDNYFKINEFNNCFIIQSPSYFFVYLFVCFLLMNFCGKRSDLPLPRKSDRKKETSVVSFPHEQNIICSETQLDAIAHWQTIICRQLFAGHVVGFRPMKRKKNWHRKFNPCYFRIVSRVLGKIIILSQNNCFRPTVRHPPNTDTS